MTLLTVEVRTNYRISHQETALRNFNARAITKRFFNCKKCDFYSAPLQSSNTRKIYASEKPKAKLRENDKNKSKDVEMVNEEIKFITVARSTAQNCLLLLTRDRPQWLYFTRHR